MLEIGVEGTVGDVAVVLQADLDAVAEARGRDRVARVVHLALRQRHADGLHAEVLGGVHRHAAPAAADVEEPHAGPQAELAADQVVLRALRVGQRRLRRGEVGARVGHRLAEEEAVEVVGDVVVVGDRLGVAGARVAGAAQARLLGRRLERRAERARGARGRQQQPPAFQARLPPARAVGR